MPKKILIIEDEEIVLDFLERKLTEEGYEVSVAKNGVAGMMLMREDKPDLILLDVIMPEKGGFEVMKDMKEDAELKDIPVVIISNSGQPVELSKAEELGAVDWLIKAEFNPQEVVDKVKEYING